MAKTVNLTIDNRKVGVPEGTNLIDAAATAGVHIPNLCYMKGMKGIGACRLCLVEVEGMKAPMVGCTTKVREGMIINTRTEKVQEARKFVIDLILSMHPLDCMTCTKAGVCNLQKYAYDFGLKESTFTRKKFGYPLDEANPFVKRDPDYCVLCGRCVRICKSQGTSVLDFNGRGVGSRVVTADDKPLQESSCTFCGSCIDVCPVNSILEADRWRKGREWEYSKTDSVCLSCGNGCSITVSTREGEVVKINSGAPDGAAERYLCAIGRFGFDSLRSETRLTSPLMRVGGELKAASWDDALKAVAAKLKDAGSQAGFITTGSILNEDALTLKKLADEVKTKNVDSSVSLYADYDSLKAGAADTADADLFVLVGTAPDQWARVLPALDAVIRRQMSNTGAKLIVIGSGETRISSAATAALRGDEVKKVEELCQALISKGVKAPKEMVEALASVNPGDDAMAASEIFAAAKSPVIFATPALYKVASNLSLIKGEAVAVPFEANAKGIVAMGLTSEGKKFREMAASGAKALYVVGEVPVTKRPQTDFLVVQASHLTELAAQADVVLPAAAGLESEGTMVDYLGRLKEVKKAVEPAGDSKANGEIFIAVAEAMGGSIKMPKDTEVKKALKGKVKVSFSPFRKDKDLDIDAVKLTEAINASAISGSRLLWLWETEKAATV